jgi:hypothetical protein
MTIPAFAAAQDTSTGTLTVTATIESSIGLTFENDTASSFTVSSPFAVKVVKANTSSATYRLAAALGSADSTNTWRINAIALTTANADLGATYAYGLPVSHTMYLTVPFTASTGAVSKILNFTATAN